MLTFPSQKNEKGDRTLLVSFGEIDKPCINSRVRATAIIIVMCSSSSSSWASSAPSSLTPTRTDAYGLPFDVILGADIIYHRTDLNALVDTIGFFMSEAEPEESATATRWKVASTDALVAIAMQERQYGARDQLVQTMRERLGMVARVLDVPRLFDEDEGGYWVGGNDYMVVFHHPRSCLDLALLGPEMASDGHEDEEQLLLSISPPS